MIREKLQVHGQVVNNERACKQWRRQGGVRGAVAPHVEKDGPRNSSKFDEKIGEGYGYPSQI